MKVKIATKDFVAAANAAGQIGQNNLPIAEFVTNHLPAFVYLEVGDDQVITDTPIHKREEDKQESVPGAEDTSVPAETVPEPVPEEVEAPATPETADVAPESPAEEVVPETPAETVEDPVPTIDPAAQDVD